MSIQQSNGAASTNGKARYQADKVRVAIIGVGNCASAFVQGVHYYKDADPHELVPGLMHVGLGGYHVRDIEFTAAFDAVLTDLRMPGASGLDLLKAVRSRDPRSLVFVLTAFGDAGAAGEAIRAGAYDFISKPYDLPTLRAAIAQALERRLIVGNTRPKLSVRHVHLPRLFHPHFGFGVESNLRAIGRIELATSQGTRPHAGARLDAR